MRKMPSEQFQSLVEAGYESPNVEFKSPFKWDDPSSGWLRECVIRATLGMANTKNGGVVVVGIEEGDGKAPVMTGVTEEQAKSFIYDVLKGKIDGFASPRAEFDILSAEASGRNFIVLNVKEFDEQPVVCRKDGEAAFGLLRDGDVYVRQRRGPVGTIRATESEMRELIDLAVDKSAAKLFRRGWRPLAADAETHFAEEREGF